MCGIIAYVGSKPCRKTVMDGLFRLEYRGYDSAGYVCINNKHKHFSYHKEAGGLCPIRRLSENTTSDGTIGMGHTRWATHGIVDLANTHPHFNCSNNVAVMHNGIIEDYEKLRTELLKHNHTFTSLTDTEIVAHLYSSLLDEHNDLKIATIKLTSILKGAYGLVFLLEEYPDTLIVVRHRSPMVIGIGDNEHFIASDFVAFSDKTDTVVFIPDETFGIITKDSIELFSFDGSPQPYLTQKIDQSYKVVGKQHFEHYMLKEIYEQKKAINKTILFCRKLGGHHENSFDDNPEIHKGQHSLINYNTVIWKQLGLTPEQVKKLKYINIIGAGTSWHAGRIAQFFFEMICHLPTRVYLASEFCYMPFFVEEDSLYIMISQSGETADTLLALQLINKNNGHTIAITNVPSSSMVRQAGGFIPMQAGPEISVASTKAFSTQLATLYWLANRMALEQGKITTTQMEKAEDDLFVTSEILETTIEIYKQEITQTLAPKYAAYNRFIFLGRHISYPFALESALKLKEISYIFSQCYPAGELKHGPIALIDETLPVIILSIIDDTIYPKLVSNAQSVKARNGHLVVFAFEGQDELINLANTAFILPKVTPLLGPLAMTGLMQFFVYQITRQLGLPIDKPRNLAKSVTVE